jgi:hypothetical protein
MVPRPIEQQLSRLGWRLRATAATWGLARWLALVAAVLAVACFIDWRIDLRRDTPWALRLVLTAAQGVLAAVAGALLIAIPLTRRRTAPELALWVEDRVPDLGHRLISAVELNRPDADTRGMSPALIAAVTREAEEQATAADWAALVDRRPWKWSGGVIGATVLVWGVFLLGWPALASALLARQLLADVEVPRSVALANQTREVWPSGEEVVIRYTATGPGVREDLEGEVVLQPEDQPAESYPLTPEGNGVFVAHVPIATADFLHRAYLADGRSRQPSKVHFKARPAVKRQDAWVQLPRYCGLRPDGQPYEQPQSQAEIVGLPGSAARLVVTWQEPVQEARVELLGRPWAMVLGHLGLIGPAGPAERAALVQALTAAEQTPSPQGNEAGPEIVLRRVPLRLEEGGKLGEVRFDLRTGESGYQLIGVEENGFATVNPVRREITFIADEPPTVAWITERFADPNDPGKQEESEVEGSPVPLGKTVRLAYTCADAFGLDRAQLRYRVNEGPWRTLPLAEVKATEASGPFDPATGAFQNSRLGDQVEFHAVPSPEPNLILGRTDGGGRFDFQTKAIPDLKIGDQIEFVVEVFDRNPEADRPPGRSELRRKAVVSEEQFVQWILENLQHHAKLRQLEAKQKGVFDGPGPAK